MTALSVLFMLFSFDPTDDRREEILEAPFLANSIINGRVVPIVETDIRVRTCPGDRRQEVSFWQEAGAAMVDEAVRTADEALPAWARKTPMDRARIIANFLALVRAQTSEIAKIMRLEAGKPIHEAMGEVLKGIQILEWALGIGHRLGGITRSGEGGAVELWTRARPLGVVALITPWNFPWAVPLWKIAPALIAGNTIVLKGSEHTPYMNTMIGELLMQAGLPCGVLNVVQGGAATVQVLVSHKDVKGVSFTGGNRAGYAINRHIANRVHPIPYQAELGGNNGVYISKHADIDLAVEGVIAGKYGSAGQRCTATQRVIVHKAVLPQTLGRLQSRIEQIQLGLSDDPSVKTMGPLVTREQLERVEALCMDAIHEGAEQIVVGDVADKELSFDNYMRPTALLLHDLDVAIWCEEIFGPALVVLPVDSFEDGIHAVNDSKYGFVAAIYSEDRRELQRFRDEVEAGMIHLNEPTAGGEPQVGFGGWKATGIGLREMDEGVEFFVRRQTIFDSSSTAGGKLAAR